MAERKQTLVLISIALVMIGAILVFVAVKSPRVYDEPSTTEASQSVSAEVSNAENSMTEEFIYPINLNTATADELTMVKGIGEAKANSIIAYREEHGAFNSVEELKEVDGIGDTLYEQIAGSFTV